MIEETLSVASAAGSIFHPSDFSEASEVAFAHALKMALVSKATLYVLHVFDRSQVDWHEFPSVRATLARWGLLPAGSPRGAAARLGIDVCKVTAYDRDPVTASLGFLASHPTDLVVLAVHRDAGRLRWLQRSVGAPMARGSGQMTLFIPYGVEGFVSRASGAVSLSNILVPVEARVSPQRAVDASVRLIRQLGLSVGNLTLLDVGTSADPAERILEVASDISADLIVMPTDGPPGVAGLRGTTSERVLRTTTCPVASLPAGAAFAQA